MKKADNGSYEISIYKDNGATVNDISIAVKRLSIAFPKMDKEFFVLLSEFINREKFTANRLKDAVNNLIANFQYKEINISDVLKFDKKVKLLSHSEYYQLITAGKAVHEDYDKLKIDGKIFYYRKDIKQ